MLVLRSAEIHPAVFDVYGRVCSSVFVPPINKLEIQVFFKNRNVQICANNPSGLMGEIHVVF